jgi:tRNA pseudouridine32 synthase/23S rRNA pseudouridine746 synthase
MVRPFIYKPPKTPLEIIFIDSSIIVLNKPAGLLTVPGRPEDHSDCLLTRVRKEVFGALLVHRLDLDTSGVIIFARTSSSQVNLGRQFEKRKTRKVYLARVSGHVVKDEGVIDLPIIIDWANRPIQKVCFETGKSSITNYKVLDRQKLGVSLIELRPITGRSHQLRLHMKSIGHPILGDPLYADEATFKASNRLNLHSFSLEITHPKTEQPKIFSVPVPF